MTAKNIIIAPHSDDAILSVGGRILANPEREEFEVLNTFSTCASTILQSLTDPVEITRLNNAEESAALESTGTNVHFMYLPEVMLRGYSKWNLPPEYPKDSRIKDKIKKRILTLLGKMNNFYFPLGIGNHTDHLICVDSAIELFQQGAFRKRNLLFYEDLPYAIDSPFKIALEGVSKSLGRKLEQRVIDISEVVDRKVELIGFYKTQYDTDYTKKMKQYASGIVERKGKFYERCWKVEI